MTASVESSTNTSMPLELPGRHSRQVQRPRRAVRVAAQRLEERPRRAVLAGRGSCWCSSSTGVAGSRWTA